MFYGQFNEDKIIASLFPENYIGICIDVGASDGISGSNTYYFEKKGWRALCIEPNLDLFNNCKSIRNECINCCISDNDYGNVIFNIFHLGTNTSAISSLKPDDRLIESHKHLITNTSTCISMARSLNSLLGQLNFPKNIDFITIDTENTELDVLQGLDFSIYNIKVLVIENNFNEPFCEDYLKQFGYTKIHRQVVNDFYVHKDFNYNQLNI